MFQNDGSIVNHDKNNQISDAIDQWQMENNIPRIVWRFTKSRRYASDGKVRKGKYLQVNRWPSCGIERTQDWGWVMQNQWVAYVYPSSNLRPLHEDLEKNSHQWY